MVSTIEHSQGFAQTQATQVGKQTFNHITGMRTSAHM